MDIYLLNEPTSCYTQYDLEKTEVYISNLILAILCLYLREGSF
jgi:hypothetical protein